MSKKVINGIIYTKESDDVFYHNYNESKKIPFSIVCECDNNKFTLKYGSYEIVAICTKCGRREVVYDG